MTTYGDVAEVAGYPRQARLVGRILATTDVDVPWWRVVNAAGRIVSGHPERADQRCCGPRASSWSISG